MTTGADITITCRQCGKDFIYSAAEQEFFKTKGFAQPFHCRECRSTRRKSQTVLKCSNCDNELSQGTAIHCTACSTAVQLEFELEVRKLKSQLDEANAKLSVLESEKAQLASTIDARLTAAEAESAKLVQGIETRLNDAESEKAQMAALFQQQQQATAKAQKRFQEVSNELEMALQYRASLDWFEPAFTKIKESLDILERNQNSLNQKIIELSKAVAESQNISVLEALKRLFRPNRNSPVPNGR